MSFSHNVKDELYAVVPGARHCQIAELSAMLSMAGRIYTDVKGRHVIKVVSENRCVVDKCRLLIYKAFSYEADCTVRYNRESNNTTYIITVSASSVAIKILLATRLMDVDGSINKDFALVNTIGINSQCCKRAYLRGAFLAGGSISDPEKSYHFEIVSSGSERAGQIADAMKFFELDARIVERRRYYVVYLKEGAQIVDMLNVMEAHASLLKLEDMRVLKEVRNSINRQVNCETANLNKTVNAAVKQIEDIEYIQKTIGLEELDEGLEEIARLRLNNPDTPLKELGTMLSVPVGKSGVNHRLRKISQIAEDIRQKRQ